MRLQEKVRQQRRGFHLVGQLDEHAERERVVDDRLTNVEDARAAPRENAGERVGDAGLVVAADVDVEDASLGLHGHEEHLIIAHRAGYLSREAR